MPPNLARRKEEQLQTNTTITKDMSFTQALQTNPKCAEVFSRHRLGCIGCIAAAYETIEQGATAHGIDVDVLVRDLNAV